MESRRDIREQSELWLEQWLISKGYPKFRVKQIMQWIWLKGVTEFEDMSNLPKDLRAELGLNFYFKETQIFKTEISKDQTIKTLFRLYDGNFVEGVLIPAGTRVTACISSQVGCSLNCRFCATGYLDRKRNLQAAEIVDQFRLLSKLAIEKYGNKLSNVVFMGMGEPLLNYSAVKESIRRITSKHGYGFSPQRITVSTAGIVKMIYKLADDNLGVELALSLHSADATRRSFLMPINESNSLTDLKDAMKYFYVKTHKRPTLEYTVIEGINDNEDEMLRLANYAKQFPCKINLIEYNPITNAQFQPADGLRLDLFAEKLGAFGLIVNVRRSRGRDIAAACGQLAANKSGVEESP